MVGSGGLVNWPALFAQLSSMDCWLWGHLKSFVYTASISDFKELQQREQNACMEVRVKRGIFEIGYLCEAKSLTVFVKGKSLLPVR
jgi:hypothetical protein